MTNMSRKPSMMAKILQKNISVSRNGDRKKENLVRSEPTGRRKEWKTIKTFIMIKGFFVVSWIPFGIFVLLTKLG